MGGPIALVREGDIISIDIVNHAINVKVSDGEMAKRKASWKPREPKITTGYLARYAAMVTSGNRRRAGSGKIVKTTLSLIEPLKGTLIYKSRKAAVDSAFLSSFRRFE